jgi:hypothetical protein
LKDVLILVDVAERPREKNPVLADSLSGSTNKHAHEKSFFRKWDVGVGTGFSWLQESGRWWALVNVVMNLQVP